MCFAAGTANFGPPHAIGSIAMLFHSPFLERLIETWPASAGLKLRLRTEQRLPAGGTSVRSRIFRFVILAAKRRLGASLAPHLILLGGQFSLPFFFGFLAFVHDQR